MLPIRLLLHIIDSAAIDAAKTIAAKTIAAKTIHLLLWIAVIHKKNMSLLAID